MGVRGLMTYCTGIQTRASNKHTNKRIGIDAFSIIFLFRDDRERFIEYFKNLKEKGHTITFVMDRKAQKEKKETVDNRKERRFQAKDKAEEISTFTQTVEFSELAEEHQKVIEKTLEKKKRDAWCLYPEYNKWLVKTLEELEIPLVYAKEEADSYLTTGSDFDIIISSDSDLLILGANILWIPKGVGNHYEILKSNFLNHVGLEGRQLYELAFIAGCDIQPKKFTDIITAISWLRFYGSIEVIQKKFPKILSTTDIEHFNTLLKTAWNIEK